MNAVTCNGFPLYGQGNKITNMLLTVAVLS